MVENLVLIVKSILFLSNIFYIYQLFSFKTTHLKISKVSAAFSLTPTVELSKVSAAFSFTLQ